MTANGSRICDSSRVALVAIDADHTLTSNSDKIIYAAGANDDGCRMRSGEGGHTLQYRVLAGSWATLPTSNGSGPFLASSGTVLSNDSTVSSAGPAERRANLSGTGSYKESARQFTTSTNLDYATQVRDDHTEGQWALDFSNCPDGTTYEFRVRWGTKNCNDQYVIYAAQITTASGGGGVSHHWAFDETSGTTAADSLGSSDGTLMNFPLDDSQWSCLNGGSLLFDGVNDYVSLPTESDYDFTSAVTVATWINVTSFSVAEQAIVTKGDTAWRLERNASTNTVQFAVDGLSTNTVVQGSVSVDGGGWHHIAGVYDGAQLLLYVDGQLDVSVTATGTMDTNNSAVLFGDNAQVGGRYFKGLMDDVYIYDTALNAASVLALAQRSLLGWWKLDETAGTIANDSSGNGNNGTLQNMAGTQWTTGRDNGGLDFTGPPEYIDTTMASTVATTATLMAWFRSDATGPIGDDYVKERFITQRRGSESSRFALGINNDHVAVYYNDGGTVTEEAVGTTVTPGVWYHAAVTYDGTTVRLYVNGVEGGAWTDTLDGPSADNILIGCHYSGFRHFDGVLDDVRLYDRGLCAAEVAAIYDETRGLRIVSWQEVEPS